MINNYSRSAWAEACILIDGKPVDFNSFPWVVKPLDSDAKRIAIRKGAQIGFSTALCVARPIFDVFHDRSVLIVQPREIDAKDFQSKLIQVIDDLPSNMTGNVRARAGLIHFQDLGTRIYIRSSGSRATGIRSLGVDTVIVDEASAVKMQVFAQAMSRLDASKSKCFIALSTPTYPGTPISEQFLAGDQQLWFVTCEHCGESKPVDWESSFQLYPDAPEKSFVRCPVCNYIRNEDKSKWRADWKQTAAAAPAGIESYGISQLVSHRVENKEIAEKAIAANRDVGGMKTFYNDQLGLDWVQNDSNRLHLWEVQKCIRPYANASILPRDNSAMHLLAVDQGSIRSSFLVAKVEFPMGSNRHPVDSALMTLVAVGTSKESDWDAIRELQRDFNCWVTVADRAGSSKVLAQEFARSSRAPTWLAQYAEDNSIAEFRESETASYPLVLINRTWELAQYQQRFKQRKIAMPNDLEELTVQQFANTMLDQAGKRFVALGDDHYAHCCGYLEVALRLAIKHFSASVKFTRRTAG